MMYKRNLEEANGEANGRKNRKQIYIEAFQESILKQITEATGRSEAEIIREAITSDFKVQEWLFP